MTVGRSSSLLESQHQAGYLSLVCREIIFGTQDLDQSAEEEDI